MSSVALDSETTNRPFQIIPYSRMKVCSGKCLYNFKMSTACEFLGSKLSWKLRAWHSYPTWPEWGVVSLQKPRTKAWIGTVGASSNFCRFHVFSSSRISALRLIAHPRCNMHTSLKMAVGGDCNWLWLSTKTSSWLGNYCCKYQTTKKIMEIVPIGLQKEQNRTGWLPGHLKEANPAIGLLKNMKIARIQWFL